MPKPRGSEKRVEAGAGVSGRRGGGGGMGGGELGLGGGGGWVGLMEKTRGQGQ